MFGVILVPFCTLIFFYVIWRFTAIFGGNVNKWIIVGIALIMATISVFSVFTLGNNKFIDIVGTIGSRLFVLGVLLTILLGIEHIISIWYKVNPRIVIGFLLIIFGLGIFFSLHTKIINLDIQSDKIQKDTKILLVSDIHVDHILSTFHINKIINTIKREKPDFVIIAGDLLNKPNADYVKYFSKLMDDKLPPILAAVGNHDVMFNTEVVQKIPGVSNIKLLNNESIEINGIQVIGIIDKSIRGNNSIKDIMDQVDLKNDSELFSILITHQPISLEKLEDYPVDLEVAGHTHRGQFYGIRELVEILNDYGYGKYEHNGRIAFVTQGIGTWGLPFRLGTQSEMVIINLIKK